MTNEDRNRVSIAAGLLLCLFAQLLCNSGCPSPYVAAYRSVATVRATAVTTEQALTDVCHLKRVNCLEAHGAGTPAYAACWEPCKRALTAWTTYTRPAINSALVLSVGSIRTAEIARSKIDALAIAKSLGCGFARAATEWIHLLPVSIRATAEAVARGAAGFTCPKEVP